MTTIPASSTGSGAALHGYPSVTHDDLLFESLEPPVVNPNSAFEDFYSLFCGAEFDRGRGDFQFAAVYPLCYNAHDNF